MRKIAVVLLLSLSFVGLWCSCRSAQGNLESVSDNYVSECSTTSFIAESVECEASENAESLSRESVESEASEDDESLSLESVESEASEDDESLSLESVESVESEENSERTSEIISEETVEEISEISEISETSETSEQLSKWINVEFSVGEGYLIVGERTAEQGTAYVFSLTLNEGYEQSIPLVTVNGERLQANNGSYSYLIKDTQTELYISVENVRKNVYEIVFVIDGIEFVTQCVHGEKLLPEEEAWIQEYIAECESREGVRCVWDKEPSKTFTCSATYTMNCYVEISDVADFLRIDGSTSYVLINDIDFSDFDLEAYTVTVQASALVASFSGVLNGNGFAVKNLTLSGGKIKNVFGKTQNAVIKNISFENVVFAGVRSPLYEYPVVQGSALIGEWQDTTLQDVTVKLILLGVPKDVNEDASCNAGVALLAKGGAMTGCTVYITTPRNSSKKDGAYALFVTCSKENPVAISQLQLQASVGIENHKDSALSE